MAFSVSSPGTSLEAANTLMSGHFSTWPPLVNLRSLRSVSRAFRMALFDLKTSSRNTTSDSGSMAAVDALAEGGDVDRAEDLVGLGEAREQVLEVLGLHQLGEGADERALGSAGRAQEHAVLASDDGDEQQADDLVLAQELPLERAG